MNGISSKTSNLWLWIFWMWYIIWKVGLVSVRKRRWKMWRRTKKKKGGKRSTHPGIDFANFLSRLMLIFQFAIGRDAKMSMISISFHSRMITLIFNIWSKKENFVRKKPSFQQGRGNKRLEEGGENEREAFKQVDFRVFENGILNRIWKLKWNSQDERFKLRLVQEFLALVFIIRKKEIANRSSFQQGRESEGT